MCWRAVSIFSQVADIELFTSPSITRGSAIAKIVGANAAKNPKFDNVVNMWVFEEMVDGRKLTEIINTDHENVKYLPGRKLPDNVVRVLFIQQYTSIVWREGALVHKLSLVSQPVCVRVCVFISWQCQTWWRQSLEPISWCL